MNTLLLTLEVIYPNFETIKIKCIAYTLSNDKRTLYVHSYYDRFSNIITIPKQYVLNVFLIGKHNVKTPLFR